MGHKYKFKCMCPKGPAELGFTASYFINPRDQLLDYLDNVYWKLRCSGSTTMQVEAGHWPQELSKRYFNTAARKYADKILCGEESILCGFCDCDIVVKKV